MKIEFIPASQQVQDIIESPVPAKTVIPDWYKQIMPDRSNPNIKSCPPFLDSLTLGYIQKTWADIYVRETVDGITIDAPHETVMINLREPNHLPEMPGYLHYQFIWSAIWSAEFPPNFSGLVVHPLNRIDLPFYTFSGVIEYDEFQHVPFGNLPFYLKAGFTGLIPKGTPMYQIIPFARENWESSDRKYDSNFWDERVAERANDPHNWYKKNIWKKKDFEKEST
jgi:hypothetical protein